MHHPGSQYQAAGGVQACKQIYLLIFSALTDPEFVFTVRQHAAVASDLKCLLDDARSESDLRAGLPFVGLCIAPWPAL